MNRPGILLAALLLLGGSVGSIGQEVVEAIVAIVNDEIITLSDYQTQHDVLYRELKARGEEFQEQYESAAAHLLDDMILGIILLQKARELDIDVTEQIKMYIEDIKQKNGIESDAQLKLEFEKQGVDFEEWQTQMREIYLRDMAVYAEVGRNVVIDDGEIFTYYRQHPEEFTEPPEYRIRGIFISGEDKSAADAERKKQEILDLLEGGEDFGSLAGTHSEGPNKDKQGDLGTFKQGDMLDAFEQEVAKLEAGGVTPWISIQSGWYLLRLEERTESRLLAFEDVRDQIQENIFATRTQAERVKYLEKLKAASFIKILISDPLERIERRP
ncbi:MAG: peptidyl-prolyl cis-trans isomerase [Candidatus Aminicenantaceae bacterium]